VLKQKAARRDMNRTFHKRNVPAGETVPPAEEVPAADPIAFDDI